MSETERLFVFVNSNSDVIKYYNDLYNYFIVINTNNQSFYSNIRDEKLVGIYNINMKNYMINNFIINNILFNNGISNNLDIVIFYGDLDVKSENKKDILRYILKYSINEYLFNEEKFFDSVEIKNGDFYILNKNDIYGIKNKIF